MKKTLIAIGLGLSLLVGCTKKDSRSMVTPTPPVTGKVLTYIIDTTLYRSSTNLTPSNCFVANWVNVGGGREVMIDTFRNWVNVGGPKFRLDINITLPDNSYTFDGDINITTALYSDTVYFLVNSYAPYNSVVNESYRVIFDGDTLR